MVAFAAQVQLKLVLPHFKRLIVRFIALKALLIGEVILIDFILRYAELAFYNDKEGKLKAVLQF